VGRVFKKRADATEYTPVAGDKFEEIVKTKCEAADQITWEEVALYNWGTKETNEVARALVELLGVRKWDDPDPIKWELDPARGIGKKVLLPKLMKKEGLPFAKVNKLQVKQQLPATAVSITKLDKWFLPGDQTCDVSWQVEGLKTRAEKLDFDVYASNYCKATPANQNDFLTFTYTSTPDVPIRQKPVTASADERGKGDIKDWKGESEASDGILKPAAPATRYVNAASSPYTVMLRYYQDDATKDALLRIQGFWPRWSGTGAGRAPVADSLKIKWYCKDCPDGLQGQFLISDKDDSIVWRQAIPTAKCGNGDQEIDWSTDGTAVVAEDKMPYRVQIQLHTDKDTSPGFALAAMHTEVRLYVDKDTYPLDLDPYVAVTDKISLDLSIADLYHKAQDPQKGDGKLWTKFALAKAGFHPGPVNDGATNAHFESALNEFQRSVPKGSTGKYTRLALSAGGDDNAETKDALEKLTQARRRPWFGQPADRSDWADTVDASGAVTQEFRKDPNFLTALRDPAGRMIVWVDDRNWYTDFAWIGASDDVNPTIRSIVTGDPADLGNLRGEFTAGDLRVGYDARDIARPWIPLQADFRLLRKADTLTDVVAAETDEAKAASMRKLIGPVRVDWSFDEIEDTAAVNLGATVGNVDLPVLDPEIEAVLSGQYNRERNRTRAALRYALNALKAEHPRLDIHKRSKYYNAPESCGGARPAAAAVNTYFSKPFGTEDESLRPYIAKTTAIETVYTVAHDQLGQAADAFFEKCQGRAGIYFHPSRIAGDGYQVRAQVRFDQAPDYQFPNLDTLKARYPKLPQAQSTRFRLWRKTSVRGYVGWSPVNSWTGGGAPPRPNIPAKGPTGFRGYYTGCHVHVANELGVTDADLNLSPAGLFDLSDYRDMVKQCLVPDDPRRGRWWQIRFHWISIGATFWPYSGHNQFGIVEASAANLPAPDGFEDINQRVIERLWDKYAVRVSAEMVKQIEKRKGWMRGHVIVEYQTTPDAYYRRYQCKRCRDVFTFVQNAAGAILKDEACPTPGCGDKWFSAGKLRCVPRFEGHYVCSTDPTHTFGPAEENSAAGPGVWGGHQCPDCNAAGVVSTISLEQVNSGLYVCNECKFEGWYPEPGAGGSHQNQACPCLCGGQLKSQNQPLANQPHVEILQSDNAKLLQYSSGGVNTPGLPSSSLGNPVGVALNFLGDTDLWGHEMAHCRHYEHAGNAPPPGDPSGEHDSGANTTVNWADPLINETDPVNQTWDRACLMTYATDLPNYDNAKDMPCFCFKCVLKNRGWRLHDGSIPAVPGDAQDP
jgi:hypothetical protein